MDSILAKVRRSLKQNGISKTLLKIVRYPMTRIRNRRETALWKEILKDDLTAEQRFNAIYEKKLWGDGESVSGYGSSLAYTENLRSRLPNVIAKYQIKTVFDAPCGDLNWIRHLLPSLNAKYIGGDIVKDLIETHKESYENPTTSFLHINLIEDSFPNADLMICRDCLFHLSCRDIKKVLDNFVASEITYLLTTTHITDLPNQNITTGGFRLLNLFEEPYCFDKNPLERIDDWMEPEPERQMCLWRRSQVISALEKMNLLLNR